MYTGHLLRLARCGLSGCLEGHGLSRITTAQAPGSASAGKRRPFAGPVAQRHRQPAPGPWNRQVNRILRPGYVDHPLPLHFQPHLVQFHAQPPGRAFLLEEVVDFGRLHKAVACGDDESNAPPASADDGRELMLERAKLELVVPLPGAGMVRLGGDEVAPRDKLVAPDGSVVVDRPAVVAEALGAIVGTKRKSVSH
jgi:hypothetical protein